MIYRVVDGQVVIYLIADGRRDMQALLARRLLGASSVATQVQQVDVQGW
nr:hypothetical protein [Ottowia sp.]